MNETILITGANGGLGKESARQLAMINGTEKIYLACRNLTKAEEAKQSLENSTGKTIFEIVIMDVSDPNSVRSAVAGLNEPIDALIMNAGGMGGKSPLKMTSNGVTSLFAANVLGHVVLLDELIKEKKLNKVALYAGSEGARGVEEMGMKRPEMKTSSEDEFASISDGTFFDEQIGASCLGLTAEEEMDYWRFLAKKWEEKSTLTKSEKSYFNHLKERKRNFDNCFKEKLKEAQLKEKNTS